MASHENHILIIAGEASGDMHGASLVRALRARRPDLSFFGIGGDAMAGEGVTLLRHVREMAFLGFVEVVKHLPFIRAVFAETMRAIEERGPAAAILIDYPGFNLRVAEAAKKRGVPVLYYISPQVWAWGRGRVKKIAGRVDKMLVLFGFEEPIYKRAGVDVAFVGHPLKDATHPESPKAVFFRDSGLEPGKPLLGLLPGSRLQEIQRLLPVMKSAFRLLKGRVPGLQATLGMAPTLSDDVYRALLGDASASFVATVRSRTHDVMAHSDAALVASGTATLETAILGTPLVILYKMAPVSYCVGRLLVKTEHIGLVNIVAGRRIVPELIQNAATPEAAAGAVLPMLTDPALAARIRTDLADVAEKLGPPGASDRAAEQVLVFLNQERPR
jgi:lipid-A-disaccharide synthase